MESEANFKKKKKNLNSKPERASHEHLQSMEKPFNLRIEEKNHERHGKC